MMSVFTSNFDMESYLDSLSHKNLYDYSVYVLETSQKNLAKYKKQLETYKKMDHERVHKNYDEIFTFLDEQYKDTEKNFTIAYNTADKKCKETTTDEDIEICKRIMENMEAAKENYVEVKNTIDDIGIFLNVGRMGPSLAKLAHKKIIRDKIPINENDDVANYVMEQIKYSKTGGKRRRKTSGRKRKSVRRRTHRRR